MTLTLAKFGAGELANATRLAELSDAIRGMTNPADIADIRAKIETVKAYAKAKELGDEVAATAAKLSIQCALQIGMCGDQYLPHIVPASHRQHVKYILRHRTYDDALRTLADNGGILSLVALARIVRAEEQGQWEKDTARNVATTGGNPLPDYDEFFPLEDGIILPEHPDVNESRKFIADRADAVQSLINGATGPFRVSDIADQYMNALRTIADAGESPEKIREALGDPNLQEGIAEMVRHELRFARNPEGLWVDDIPVPAYVTYFDGEAGAWLRIPWSEATVTQVRSMATFRRKQADQVDESARELEMLADALEGKTIYSWQGDETPVTHVSNKLGPRDWGRDEKIRLSEIGKYHRERIQKKKDAGVWNPEGPCPYCDRPSVYVLSLEKFVHESGASNVECWKKHDHKKIGSYIPVITYDKFGVAQLEQKPPEGEA